MSLIGTESFDVRNQSMVDITISGNTVRFIIITVPPPDVADRIDAFRLALSEVGATLEARTYPPHVTMRTGAIVPVDEVASFAAAFVSHVGHQPRFQIETAALEQSCYEANGTTRYFIGYRIVESSELLAFNRHLLDFTRYRKSSATHFHPHLTIAFHDLTADRADRVAGWISNNRNLVPDRFAWTCDNVGLYHKSDGIWQVYRAALF